MDALYSDYEILIDDYEKVLALEARGCDSKHPAIRQVMNRWLIDDTMVGHESVIGKAVDFAVDGTVNATGKVSSAIVERMQGWLERKEESIRKKIDEVTSKATSLSSELTSVEKSMQTGKPWSGDSIDAGTWTSKVCVEDKIDVEACIKFAEKPDVLDDVVKSYTAHSSAILTPRTRKAGSLELRKMGKSSGHALKRATGIIGLSPLNSAAEAWPLPGNVIVVLRGSGYASEVVDFAVARSGDYGDTIDPLDEDTAKRALAAAWKLTEHLKKRNVKRGAFSYSGIYEKIEQMRKESEGEVDKKAINMSTKRLRNALAVEDALTTAMVRVCEGLTKYVRESRRN